MKKITLPIFPELDVKNAKKEERIIIFSLVERNLGKYFICLKEGKSLDWLSCVEDESDFFSVLETLRKSVDILDISKVREYVKGVKDAFY